MIPDKTLAKEMTEQNQKNIQQRIATLGISYLILLPHLFIFYILFSLISFVCISSFISSIHSWSTHVGLDGLHQLREKLQHCVTENSRPLPPNLTNFPTIPDSEKIPILPVSQMVLGEIKRGRFDKGFNLALVRYNITCIPYSNVWNSNSVLPYQACFPY
jgi:hypothetical protein